MTYLLSSYWLHCLVLPIYDGCHHSLATMLEHIPYMLGLVIRIIRLSKQYVNTINSLAQSLISVPANGCAQR
jgi:hypothetical protein